MQRLSDTVERKFIDTIDVSEWNIESDNGWVPIQQIHKTIPYQEWIIRTENNDVLICADTHIVFDENFNEIFVKDCIPDKTKIITKYGTSLVSEVMPTDNSSNMFDLSVDSDEHRFYTGNILSHNSQLLDAICFGLFGKGFRNIPKGNFVNSINGSELVVEIEFSIGKKEYKVRRGIKPNFFDVYVDNVLLDQDANVRDQQAYFEKNILHLNWKAFTQIVILGSASHTPFMQLKTSDRREIVEELLDLRVFSVMRVLLKDKLDTNKHDIEDINYNISTLETKIELELDYIEKSKQDSSDRINKDKKEIEKTQALIDNEQTKLDGLKNDILDSDEPEMKKSLSEIQKKTSEFEKLEHQIKTKILGLQKEVNFFNENDSCPTCKQSITDVWKENAITERAGKLKTTNDGIEKLTKLTEKLKKDKESVLSSMEGLEMIRKNVILHKNTISSYEKFIEKVRVGIDEMNEERVVVDESSILSKKNELDCKNKTKDGMIDLRDIYNTTNVLLKDNGIKANIIKQYVPIINASVNKYLTVMGFFVKFTINENFEESMASRYLDDYKYTNFSEGEKKRIDLAIMLTWREIAKKKNSMSTNLLIFDEIVDGAMDAEGVDSFLKIVNNLENQNVIIISHNQTLIEKINSDGDNLRSIHFEKKKNFSTVTYE
jgi:hypothetical protein